MEHQRTYYKIYTSPHCRFTSNKDSTCVKVIDIKMLNINEWKSFNERKSFVPIDLTHQSDLTYHLQSGSSVERTAKTLWKKMGYFLCNVAGGHKRLLCSKPFFLSAHVFSSL